MWREDGGEDGGEKGDAPSDSEVEVKCGEREIAATVLAATSSAANSCNGAIVNTAVGWTFQAAADIFP